jgi:hypothetical protein
VLCEYIIDSHALEHAAGYKSGPVVNRVLPVTVTLNISDSWSDSCRLQVIMQAGLGSQAQGPRRVTYLFSDPQTPPCTWILHKQ